MPRTVFLQPADLVKHSRHHIAYASSGPVAPGNERPTIYVLEFFNGVARDVPESLYQRFKDLGIADVHPPAVLQPPE